MSDRPRLTSRGARNASALTWATPNPTATNDIGCGEALATAADARLIITPPMATLPQKINNYLYFETVCRAFVFMQATGSGDVGSNRFGHFGL